MSAGSRRQPLDCSSGFIKSVKLQSNPSEKCNRGRDISHLKAFYMFPYHGAGSKGYNRGVGRIWYACITIHPTIINSIISFTADLEHHTYLSISFFPFFFEIVVTLLHILCDSPDKWKTVKICKCVKF